MTTQQHERDLMDGAFARKRLEEIRGELDKAITVLQGASDADRRTEAVLAAVLKQRAAVLDALQRVEQGTYGWCTDCSAKVPEGRLQALPEAARCMHCQAKRDRFRLAESREIIQTPASKPARVSRRTRCATGLTVRLLPPADRARYRQEFAAELADLPRCDQAPYAIRLACRAWPLRSSLTGRRSVRSSRVVVVVTTGAGGAVCLATLGWPAAVLGSVLIIALMWIISDPNRTRHLASLIRAVHSGPSPNRKK
jgi:RNA polymerase-binding transcription factor